MIRPAHASVHAVYVVHVAGCNWHVFPFDITPILQHSRVEAQPLLNPIRQDALAALVVVV